MANRSQDGMEDQFFDPKKENLSYTTALIKPFTCLKQQNIQDIIDLIEAEGFIIKSMLNRPLLPQEIINLFYKHQQQPYFTQIINYMISSPCVIFLLCHQTEDPIAKWKGMIGNKDPIEAKKNEPNTLRAKYGIDIIKNEFHGSDDPFHANKERDIFRFPIPQKIPEFKHNRYKIPQDLLFKWLYPPKIEHPYVNNRLDLFALYGPTLNWHSVDYCFCTKKGTKCMKVAKAYLEVLKQKRIAEEKQKLGLNTQSTNDKHQTLTKSKIEDRLLLGPMRLIDEDGIEFLWKDLCEDCRKHCETYVHMCSGQEHLHIMTEPEIRIMGEELNKNELLNLLIIEKGQAAKIMIEDMSLMEPKELQYGKELVLELIKDLPTDYYKRYEFNDLQQVILEDRRIRMNAWVSSIISKPIDRFKNPKLLDQTVKANEHRNLKSVHFTLQRTLPLSMTYQKDEISHTPINFEPSIMDKKKLQSNEEGIVRVKKLHRYLHQYMAVDTNSKCIQQDFVNGLNIQRNYNPGRNGSWNNYCCLEKNIEMKKH